MRRVSIFAATAVAVVLGACSDSDDPAGIEGGLSQAEAATLAAAMSGEALGSTDGQIPGAALSPAAVPFDVNLALTLPCPLGGEVSFEGQVSGDFDVEAETLAVNVTASQVHAGCAVDAEGVTVTVTGNPGLEFSSQLTAAGNPPVGTQSATLSGAFDWSASDGRAGTCDVSLTATRDLANETGSAAGAFCGHSLDVTVG